MEKIISVIVPVYNVEKFLPKCLDSILKQTFLDFELILVDDGSTDLSGKICDEYAKLDKRIIVIHQQNGGPGKARNTGIQIAKGAYITFADSDDWIADNMLKEMHSLMIMNDVDIVVSSHYIVNLDNSIEKVINTSVDKLINRIEATSLILEDKIIYSFAWDKLYKRKLFEGVKYPEKRIIEDIATTYKLINNAENIFLSRNAYYYYVRRENSSCLNPNPLIAMNRRLDYFNGFYERYEFTASKQEYAHMINICQEFVFDQGLQFLHFIVKNKLNKRDFPYFEILSKLSAIDFSNNELISKRKKLEHKLMRISFGMYTRFLQGYYYMNR